MINLKFDIKKDMHFDYEIYMEDDIITIHKHDETFFDILINSFWNFITENDMNQWCNDYHNPAEYDGHGQDTGEYTKDEYFDLPYDHIKADLEKYFLKPIFKKYFI